MREQRDLEKVLCEVERADVTARLEGDALAEFEGERDTINAQLRSPRRKRSIVVTAPKRLEEFAQETGAGVAAAAIARWIGAQPTVTVRVISRAGPSAGPGTPWARSQEGEPANTWGYPTVPDPRCRGR